MTKNIKRDQKTPSLRFPGFSGEWQKAELLKYVTSHNSGIYKKADMYGEGVNIIGVSNLYDNSFINGQVFKRVPLSKEEIENYSLNEGDLLYGESSLVREGIAKTLVTTKEGAGTAFAWHTRRYKVDTKIISPQYLYYFLNTYNSRVYFMSVATQTALTGITTNDYFSAHILFPPLVEQIKIASLLSTVDSLLDNLRSQKSSLESYKKSIMKKIFSQEIRFKGENGKSYPEWKEKKLNEIGDIIGGGTPDTTNSEYWSDEINWFTPTEIIGKYAKNSLRKLSTIGLKKSSAKLLPIGTLLFTSRATIGEVSISTVPCATNQGFQSIVVNDQNSIEFLYYWIIFNKPKFIRLSNGSTFLELSSKEMKAIKDIFPSLPEQQKIANILSSIDKSIESKEKEITSTEDWKKGLMQRMFV